MSKQIMFECDDSSAHLFVQILNKLEVASGKNHTRKIRIGGDEYSFIGGCDTVANISVDGVLIKNFTNAEKSDLENLRNAVVPVNITPVTQSLTSAPVSSSDSVNTVTVSDADSSDADLLDSTDADTVSVHISSKVAQGQMFTAFDITKEVRSSGSQVRHGDIKQIVHALFNRGYMSGYNRSLINVSGSSVRPFLYHPASSDISSYQA